MKKKSEELLFQGKWLSIHKAVFINREGIDIEWESVKRARKVRPMAIVARLVPSGRFVLIKQFRPAINGHIIGFPAGLWTDDIGQAAIELKEETGYTGKIISVSPDLKSNTGIMNESGVVVYMEIDENDPVNADPVQTLEPEEEIEVHLIEKDNIRDFIEQAIKDGIDISPSLWFMFVLPEHFL